MNSSYETTSDPPGGRSDAEWFQALLGEMGSDAQQQAHLDLAHHLDRVAYTYLKQSQNRYSSLNGLIDIDLDELATDYRQEVLEKLTHNHFEKLRQFRGDGSLRSWAKQAMYHHIIDTLRRKRHRVEERLDEKRQAKWIDTKNPSPEAAILQAELTQVLQSCIENLTERRRIAFTQCIVEGKRAKEVAETLQIQESGVNSLVYHAKQQLQKCLEKAGYGQDTVNAL